MNAQPKPTDIPGFILKNVEANPRSITRMVMEKFGISRPSALEHVNRLIATGQMTATGLTRARVYSLTLLVNTADRFSIDPSLREDTIWREHIRPHLGSLPQNVLDVCQYGVTEMVNNVIDHSGGQLMTVAVRRTGAAVEIIVQDDGVGIFDKITRALKLNDPRHAILELAKGKLTTDPEHHSGEGIFFASRMFDEFSILSKGLFFSHTQPTDDWLIEHGRQTEGTTAIMEISSQTTRSPREVFDAYSPEDAEYAFTRTHVPVGLARYGDEGLVSRSQAKRLLSRFERFGEVILDFKGVNSIGQAFADEIFRVFNGEHPDISLIAVNTSDQVRQMIARASEHAPQP